MLSFVLLAFVLMGVRAVWELSEPEAPPCEITDEHLKNVMALPNKRSRRKFIKESMEKGE